MDVSKDSQMDAAIKDFGDALKDLLDGVDFKKMTFDKLIMMTEDIGYTRGLLACRNPVDETTRILENDRVDQVKKKLDKEIALFRAEL